MKSSKPMLVLLNGTLQSCCQKGTSVNESGLTVSTERLPGEIILFFHTDCPEGRKSLSMVGEGVKVCDYLVLYLKDGEDREIVCFLELKGKNLGDAKEQVFSTEQRVLALAKEKISQERLKSSIGWKVCICLHGQAPRNRTRIEDELKDKFGKDNVRIKHGVKHDKLFGEFLRKKTK